MKKVLLILALLSTPVMAKHHHKASHSSPISMTTSNVEEKINHFAGFMHSKHDFDQKEVHDFLMDTEPDKNIFKFFGHRQRQAFTPEELEEIKHLAAIRVENGVKFYRAHRLSLEQAQRTYGVDPEDIVGLIGIETAYGAFLGKFREHQVLTTLAFYGSHRTDYFQLQLENFLVLAREYAWDRENVPCSYAGAIGIPQFMPDNMKPYAVDWNGDGRIDLMNPDDAIGSVANFLAQHGWVKNVPIATATSKRVYHKTFVLRTLPGPKPTLWNKTQNFYVIRQYNPLDSYAMAIFILATKVRDIIDHQPNDLDEIQIEIPPEDNEIENTSTNLSRAN